MALKYQPEIDKLLLKDCPANVMTPKKEIIAFRFAYEPIEHKDNFLPNIIIDKIKSMPFNYSKCDETQKCLRCGASFFLSQEKARNKWDNLSIQFKKNIGYTHISSGVLTNKHGLMNEPKNGHFTFYESENAELEKSFKLITKL